MPSLNMARGEVTAGENGLAALPERVGNAHTAIDEAISYASAIGYKAVHVIAGFLKWSEGPQSFCR